SLGQRAGRAAGRTAAGRHGDVHAEHLAQRAAQAVAVGPRLAHAPPPLGPNRSVLTCPGLRPRPVSVRAMLSTNPVGPQTNACPPESAGQDRSLSLSASSRPTGLAPLGGADRV